MYDVLYHTSIIWLGIVVRLPRVTSLNDFGNGFPSSLSFLIFFSPCVLGQNVLHLSNRAVAVLGGVNLVSVSEFLYNNYGADN